MLAIDELVDQITYIYNHSRNQVEGCVHVKLVNPHPQVQLNQKFSGWVTSTFIIMINVIK